MPIHGTWVHTKPGYKQVGHWGWDNDRLHSKIDTQPDENGCLNWRGAMSPTGALMGAWKSTEDGSMRQQMSQVRRLIAMDQTNKDISDYQVKPKCGNQRCCEISHYELKPNNRIEASKKPAKEARLPKEVPTRKIRQRWMDV